MSKRRISPAEQEQDDLRVALTGVHQESDKDVVGGCGAVVRGSPESTGGKTLYGGAHAI